MEKKYQANEAHVKFLEKLRDSGKTNMFAATPYLQREFGLDRHAAKEILLDWIGSHKEK